MKTNCIECENDALLEAAEAKINFDWAMEWAKLADAALRAEIALRELMQDSFISESNKNRLYKEQIKEQRQKIKELSKD